MATEKRAPAAKARRTDRSTIYDRVAEARERRATAAQSADDAAAPQPPATRADAIAAARALRERARKAAPVAAAPAANQARTPPSPPVDLRTPLVPPPDAPLDILPDPAPVPAAPAPRRSLRREAALWIASLAIVAVIAAVVLYSGRPPAAPAAAPDAASLAVLAEGPRDPDLLPNEAAPDAPAVLAAPGRARASALLAVPGEAPPLPVIAAAPGNATPAVPADPQVEVLRAALAATTPAESAEAEPEAPALPAAADNVRVVLLAPRSVPDDRVGLLAQALGDAGLTPERRDVNMTISRDNVRYYHAADADAAALVAEAMGAQLRDFTDFSPRPPEGLIEVWVAGRAIGSGGRNRQGGTLAGFRRDLDQMARALRQALR